MIYSQGKCWSWFMTTIFQRFVWQFCLLPDIGLNLEVRQCTQIPTENDEQTSDHDDDIENTTLPSVVL